METYERIKILRKKYLKLTQEAFGKRLGVSRDVIKNIELNLLARPNQKLSLIKLICKEFSVNEDWLLNGTEPMFIEPDTFSLDEFVKQHNGTDLEIRIMKAYFSLEPDTRNKVIDFFKTQLLDNHTDTEISEIEIPVSKPLKNIEEMTISEKVELYRQELETEEKVRAKSQALPENVWKSC